MDNEKNDSQKDFSYGYDLEAGEAIPITELEELAEGVVLPSAAYVDSNYLPPVGSQGPVPSCVAWGSVYGMTSFWAASKGNYSPTDPTNQASPAFIYIKVMQARSEGNDECEGSSISKYAHIIQSYGGTPSMAVAPYVGSSKPSCSYLWGLYQNDSPTIDSAFDIPTPVSFKVDYVKRVLSMGYPVAYGTSLYTDFEHYDGSPVLYVGNGIIKKNSKGKPAGHCMLVIGYDDNCNGTGQSAVLIQNSWGTNWGINGQMWMAFDTFTTLAQGRGFYIDS